MVVETSSAAATMTVVEFASTYSSSSNAVFELASSMFKIPGASPR